MKSEADVGVSIIICCYNSVSRIQETLKYLALQKVASSLSWEVVLVDNASTDNTGKVAQEFWTSQNQTVSLSVVNEPIPGLSHARTTGINFSIYDVIVFCDDDNHLDENYIQRAFQLMNNKPEVGIAGGWPKPKLPFYPGKWIEQVYSALAIESAAKEESYVDWVFGAGMVVRRRVIHEMEKKRIFFLLSDRMGGKQTSGGDVEICQLARFIGYKIYYSPELVLGHKISPHRLTKWSFIKANFMNVYSVAYFYLLHSLINKKGKTATRLYFDFWVSRLQHIFYYSPRVILGKHKFYSFIMLFQNIQLMGWLFVHKKQFNEMYKIIRLNLYK